MAATTIFVGAIIGASTNAVNGAISPTYFVHILHWEDFPNVWRASIAQGIFEGLVFGVLLSFIFTLTVGIISRATCTYRLAMRYLLAIALAAYGCWAVGGLIALGLATLSPDFYRRAFRGVPQNLGEMLRYAWVGGSIWGVEFGGILSLTVGLILFRANWKQSAVNTSEG